MFMATQRPSLEQAQGNQGLQVWEREVSEVDVKTLPAMFGCSVPFVA